MPTYTYACSNCGEFDLFQSIHADSLKKCPHCKRPIKRLIGQVTFFLKGDSWPSKVMKTNDTIACEKALEKEENDLLRKGHKIFPKGTSREGEII